VQTLAGIARQLRQACLNIQVHVLQVEFPFKRTSFDLRCHRAQALLNGMAILWRDDLLGAEHLRVSQRACNVGLPKPLVKKNTRGIAFHEVAHGFGKQG